MAGPLLSSKYRRPAPRPGAVRRERLTERLGAVTRTPLTLVSAPAGFGKSTLLAEWLPEAGAAGAWLSLDRRDNDPALFWTYVITALQSAVPGLGAAALQLLASSAPPTETVLAALVNEIDGWDGALVLVLDDYHVIEATQVHDGLTFVLEHQPPQLHLVLATRSDPPLPLAQQRARGRLLEVRAADLRFTAEEAASYLNGAMELRLDDADVATLEGRTEGWIAALQLAALSLQGRADAGAFIAGFAGDDHYIVDYLAEEVLARQPDDVRDFLLETSVLDGLTGPLCDAVTGRGGGRATLVALERANLFLVPLDDRRQWYRYHHLFADVLHAHLSDERPDDVAELHRRAGAWFEANGDASQAINHALAGGDPGRAADIMERAMPLMQSERRETELARWLQALPGETLRNRPVLDVAFVGVLAQRSEFDRLGERLDRIESLVRSPDGSWPAQPPPRVIVRDEEQYRALPGHVEMYRAALSLAHGDLAGTVAHASAALALAPDDDLTRAAAGALGGLASWSTGDLAAAHAAYTESTRGLARAGWLADVLGCTITLGDLRRTQGRLTDAVRTYERALELNASAPGPGPLRGTADMHVGLAGVLVERDDRAAARDQLATSERLGEYNGLPQNAYRSRVVRARLEAAEGDLDAALALLDEAERVYNGDYSPDVQPVAAVRARLRIRRGELAAAQAWADERRLGSDDAPSYLREHEHLTLARLLIAQWRAGRTVADPRPLLDRLGAAAEDGGRTASLIEVLILEAAAHDAAGDAPAAAAALLRAVSLAQPEGYVRLFADEGPRMAALLKAVRKEPAVSGYVQSLVAATTTPTAPPPAAQPLVEPLSERELDVLRLLAGDLSGPDIARRLSVSLNTVRTHTKNIYAKLAVSSRRAAVTRARELHLIPGGPRTG